MKKIIPIPEHLEGREAFEIETYKTCKLADQFGAMIPEMSVAISAAFHEKQPTNIVPNLDVMKEQYPELNDMTATAFFTNLTGGLLEGLFICRKYKEKDHPRKQKQEAEAKLYFERISDM